MNHTIGLVGANELRKYLEKKRKEIVLKVEKETYASAMDVRNQAKENLKALKAWDTGHLANTIVVERSKDRKNAEIGTVAPYGPYLEFGTKPHFPPPDALEGWARRHGFDSAWPICKAISERGTPAKPFLFPAYLAIVGEFFNRLKRILEK